MIDPIKTIQSSSDDMAARLEAIKEKLKTFDYNQIVEVPSESNSLWREIYVSTIVQLVPGILQQQVETGRGDIASNTIEFAADLADMAVKIAQSRG